MYDINTLKGLNNAAYVKLRKTRSAPESETTRHCSWAQNAKGLILHSAKKRSTVFLGGDKNIRLFLSKWYGTNSAEKRDQLVESYFN